MEKKEVSYVHQPHPRAFNHRTVFQLLDKRAEERRFEEAMILYDQQNTRQSLTFGELQCRSQVLAASLAAKGLGRGDRVALLLPNILEWAVSFMALNRLGANVVAVPLAESPGFIADVLSNLRCAGLICHLNPDQKKRKLLLDVIYKAKENSGKHSFIKHLVTVGGSIQWDDPGVAYQYEDLIASKFPTDLKLLQQNENKVQFDDPSVMLLTSGTTGRPKWIQHTNQSIVVALDIEPICVKYDCNSRGFNSFPFSWVPGLGSLCTVAVVGATWVFTSPGLLSKENAAELLLDVLSREKCNTAEFPPLLIHDIINNPSLLDRYDLSCLQRVSTGGQVVSHNQAAKFLDLLPNIEFTVGYGATETFTFVSTATYNRDGVANLEQYGWMDIAPHFEVKVTDPQGNILPVNIFGEIHVRCHAIFLHYLEDLKVNLKSKSPVGWWSSRDLGVMDEKGRIKIFGRMGDAIKRATDLLYPAQFELEIAKNHLVEKVTVVGVPDQRLYQEVCACVVLKDPASDHEVVRVELEEWYHQVWPADEDGLSNRPGYTIFLKEIPLTRTMKPDRNALKRLAVEKLGLQDVK